MSERIIFADGNVFTCPEQAAATAVRHQANGREWQRITVIGEQAAVKAAFVDKAVYAKEWDSIVTAEDGTETIEVQSRDLSEYSVAGELVDTRDGNITVYMGRPTAEELLQEQFDAAEAAMQKGVNSIDE